jgi:enoyl-CoA hydratase/carnithine racemase
MAPSDRIKVEIDRGVADVRMARAAKMNALDLPMLDALVATADTLRETPGLRAVVLSGEGRAFSAGIDLATLASFQDAAPRAAFLARDDQRGNLFQQAVLAWHDLPVPVIAAVHGVAFGGGFQIMLGADLRYVAPDAQLSVMEIRWGLVPDMAGTLLMRRLARDDVVRELCFSGRTFNGNEALALGFATRVCAEPRAEALVQAREMASRSPAALREMKQLLNSSNEATPDSGPGPRRHTQLLAESVAQGKLLAGPQHAEALAAATARRPPVFKD